MEINAALIRRALAGPHDLPRLGLDIDLRDARDAAVVVPLRLDPEPHAVLVLRGSQLADHAGEVGFPGGKPEPGDADLTDTALREFTEETAVPRAAVEILGALTAVPVITGRYLIHPFVGLLAEGAAPRVASPEIARVINLPIAPLITGAHPIAAVQAEVGRVKFFAPHFEVDGAVLYGASAYIFYELLSRVAAALGLAMPESVITDVLPWGDRYSR